MGEVLFWTVAVFAVLGMPLLAGVRLELRPERKEARERERLEESRCSAATRPSGLRRRVGRGRDRGLPRAGEAVPGRRQPASMAECHGKPAAYIDFQYV